MAQNEESVDKTEALVSVGPKPWEMMLGTVDPEEAEEIMSPKKQMPWERMLGTETIFEPPNPSPDLQLGESPDFDRVFDKLIQAESRGRHRGKGGRLTESPVGAKGITQVMPKTAADPGYGVQPIQNDTEEEYIRFGREYLGAMVKEFNGDMRKAVAAYNAGPGSVINAVNAAKKKGGDWVQFLPKKSETIPYMKKILGEA